jgi:hypothetical protein
MDGRRFDRLTKGLVTAPSRRTIARALAGGTLAGIRALSREGSAEAGGKTCQTHDDCSRKQFCNDFTDPFTCHSRKKWCEDGGTFCEIPGTGGTCCGSTGNPDETRCCDGTCCTEADRCCSFGFGLTCCSACESGPVCTPV